MGLITQLRDIIAKKKEKPNSEISQNIEAQREHFRQSANIEAMKDFERKDFFTKGNYQDE